MTIRLEIEGEEIRYAPERNIKNSSYLSWLARREGTASRRFPQKNPPKLQGEQKGKGKKEGKKTKAALLYPFLCWSRAKVEASVILQFI